MRIHLLIGLGSTQGRNVLCAERTGVAIDPANEGVPNRNTTTFLSVSFYCKKSGPRGYFVPAVRGEAAPHITRVG